MLRHSGNHITIQGNKYGMKKVKNQTSFFQFRNMNNKDKDGKCLIIDCITQDQHFLSINLYNPNTETVQVTAM